MSACVVCVRVLRMWVRCVLGVRACVRGVRDGHYIFILLSSFIVLKFIVLCTVSN